MDSGPRHSYDLVFQVLTLCDGSHVFSPTQVLSSAHPLSSSCTHTPLSFLGRNHLDNKIISSKEHSAFGKGGNIQHPSWHGMTIPLVPLVEETEQVITGRIRKHD